MSRARRTRTRFSVSSAATTTIDPNSRPLRNRIYAPIPHHLVCPCRDRDDRVPLKSLECLDAKQQQIEIIKGQEQFPPFSPLSAEVEQ